jgi:hypothetical protein
VVFNENDMAVSSPEKGKAEGTRSLHPPLSSVDASGDLLVRRLLASRDFAEASADDRIGKSCRAMSKATPYLRNSETGIDMLGGRPESSLKGHVLLITMLTWLPSSRLTESGLRQGYRRDKQLPIR